MTGNSNAGDYRATTFHRVSGVSGLGGDNPGDTRDDRNGQPIPQDHASNAGARQDQLDRENQLYPPHLKNFLRK